VRNEALGERICGLLTLDTGAFFVEVLNARPRAAWTDGAPLAVEFRGDDGQPVARTQMTVGGKAQSVVFGSAPRPEIIVQLGTAPYFAYAVLYDPVRRRLGFRARPPREGLPAPG
jgi:hypothetical protein